MEGLNLNKLNNYTLTNDMFMKYTSQNINESQEAERKHANNKKIDKSRYITPKQNDRLFWCFYILHKGFDDYSLIEDKHFSIEKEMKINFVKTIRENKHLLKRYKLHRNEVEDILINEKNIDIKVFFMFCIYYEIDIMFINRNFYYELDTCFGDTLNIIRIVNGDYCIDTQIENIAFYRNNYCKMDNICRYIKTISGYKVDELQTMCFKLDVNIMNENDKKKTKQELYNNILLLLA